MNADIAFGLVTAICLILAGLLMAATFGMPGYLIH